MENLRLDYLTFLNLDNIMIELTLRKSERKVRKKRQVLIPFGDMHINISCDLALYY